MSYCETCIQKGIPGLLAPVEAIQHKDANPDHEVIEIDSVKDTGGEL